MPYRKELKKYLVKQIIYKMSDIEKHNEKMLDDWKKDANKKKMKVYAMVVMDYDGKQLCYSTGNTSNKALAISLREMADIIDNPNIN